MAIPSTLVNGRQEIKETGGQPLVFGSIPENGYLQRQNGSSTYVITGTLVAPSSFRLTFLDIYNETTATWTRFKCRDNIDGDSELYVSDEGLSLPSFVGFIYLDMYNETTATYTRYRCRDNADADSELYISDEGLS